MNFLIQKQAQKTNCLMVEKMARKVLKISFEEMDELAQKMARS